MKTIVATRLIAAPIETVFKAISGPDGFSKAVPHIKKVEYITEQKSGAGTRFRETRMMGKKEHTSELEIKEYVENERVRMVCHAGGTIWDSVFTLSSKGDQVEMKMAMEAVPQKFMARVMNPLIRSMVAKGVEADMDSIKQYCERLQSDR